MHGATFGAGTASDRIKAVASFRGGGLATDAPDSPHRYVTRIAAEIYVAAATDDAHYPPDMAERFEAALVEADLPYRHEIYPSAHGWMKPDFPVYDPVAAERGWREMIALFDRAPMGPERRSP